MPTRLITPQVEAEIRRLVVRYSIGRVAAGYNVTDLGRKVGMFRSNIDRVENGSVTPTLPVLIRLGQAVGLRLGWVPEWVEPVLELDEFEFASLISAAMEGWKVMETGGPQEDNLLAALTKLGKINKPDLTTSTEETP